MLWAEPSVCAPLQNMEQLAEGTAIWVEFSLPRRCRRKGIQHNMKAMKDKTLKSSFGYGRIECIF